MPVKKRDDEEVLNVGALMRDIADAEGFKPTIYKDSKGNDTIGHGINLTAQPLTEAELGMLQRNRPHLETRDLKKDGISEDESAQLMLNRIRVAEDGLDRNVYWWRGTSERRQRALVELAYTHGVSGALGYKKLLAAGEAEDFDTAAHEMTRSDFAKIAPDRARRMAEHLQDFDAEGPGYDLISARAAGMKRAGGHLGSVRPATKGEMEKYDLPKGSFLVLKGAGHETFAKAVAAEEALGRDVVKRGDRYFAVPAGDDQDFLGFFKKESKNEPAPKPGAFPSSEDAAAARKAGFGYGDSSEGYQSGASARVSQADPFGKSVPEFAKTAAESTPSGGDEKTSELYTKAALAVNRSPVAALGFSPDTIVSVPKLDTPNTNLGGAFNKGRDAGFAKDAVSLAHETIHRGLGLLKEDVPDFFKGGNEELLVHYLMYRDMGDPNKGRGDASEKLRQKAIYEFELSPRADKFQAALKKIDALAVERKKKQRPAGHR